MLVLYATDVSVYSAKVAIALAYKGVAFERRAPPGGSYRSAAYRALVPAGTVPAIDDGGFVLSETDAIIEYIDETRPGPRLLPGDAQARARARFASRLHDFRIEPRVRALFPHVGAGTGERAAAEIAALRDAVAAAETLIAPAPFAAGAAFGLGDCGWAPTLLLADRLLNALSVPPLGLGRPFAEWRARLADIAPVGAVLAPYAAAIDSWVHAKTGG